MRCAWCPRSIILERALKRLEWERVQEKEAKEKVGGAGGCHERCLGAAAWAGWLPCSWVLTSWTTVPAAAAGAASSGVASSCLTRLAYPRLTASTPQAAREEAEREAMMSVDWHEFVVVETIEFYDDELDELPEPMTLKDVRAGWACWGGVGWRVAGPVLGRAELAAGLATGQLSSLCFYGAIVIVLARA